MRNVVLILWALFLFSCDDGAENPDNIQWKKLGLDGKVVNELQIRGNQLFASTNSGLFVKNYDDNENFELLGFEDQEVQSFVVVNDNLIYASIAGSEAGEIGKLFKSENGGDSWTEIENDFGGEDPETIIAIAVKTTHPNLLYGTGWGVIAKSENGGVNWEPIWGEWGGFGTGVDVINIHPDNENEIWAGGQGGIENGFLLKSVDGGEEWTEWYDLAENPSVAKEILFDKDDAEKVYVGFEGALVATSDGGSDWTTLIDSTDDSRFFFGIGKSETVKDLLFTAGWIKKFDDPQPLILFYSTDDGENWKQWEYAPEDFGGVHDLKIISDGDQERIFLGLYKGGVYEVLVKRASL